MMEDNFGPPGMYRLCIWATRLQEVFVIWRNVHLCIFRGRTVQCFHCMWSHCPKFTTNCTGMCVYVCVCFFLGGHDINDIYLQICFLHVCWLLFQTVLPRSCCHLRSERPSFMHSPSLSEYLRRMLHYAGGSSAGHHAEFGISFQLFSHAFKRLMHRMEWISAKAFLQIGSQKLCHKSYVSYVECFSFTDLRIRSVWGAGVPKFKANPLNYVFPTYHTFISVDSCPSRFFFDALNLGELLWNTS